MNVAIVGSRDYEDLEAVHDFVNALSEDTVIISGGARGVDLAAEMAARARGMSVRIFKADWEKHGKRAGFLRNREIVEAADIVVAFWDGRSRGTLHSMNIAKGMGKRVYVKRYG